MANRPIFIPYAENRPFFKEKSIDFKWYPGFSRSQAQKSIHSLHEAASFSGYSPILEISSKSPNPLGVNLSAFNLKFSYEEKVLSVECAYQGSKVFSQGGSFSDLYSVTSYEAKKDSRIRNSGEFVGYSFFGEDFPTNPQNAFYDWLYLTALQQNPHLSEELCKYKGFSDIAFNPKKSINCQARAAALFVSLTQNGEISRVLEDKSYYFKLAGAKEVSTNFYRICQEKKEESEQLDLGLGD